MTPIRVPGNRPSLTCADLPNGILSKFDCGLIKAQLSGHLWRRYERAFPRMLFVERARLVVAASNARERSFTF
jgi:hypothetical protein